MSATITEPALFKSRPRPSGWTAGLRRVEGQRDGLLLLLCDLEGAHDQRVVAVR